MGVGVCVLAREGETCADAVAKRGAGLDDAALERLAQLGPAACKTSRRDLPFVIARRATGATTVSATMLLAAAAGVRVFVTGGIGGVHRGGQHSWDVSADLSELGRTPVAVVCAGAKSILDIPRTLEVLETQGVAVAALGADEFPAFYTRRSGAAAPWRLDTPAQAAAAIAAAARLGLRNGMVLAVPIPEAYAAEGAAVEAATQCVYAAASMLRLQHPDLAAASAGPRWQRRTRRALRARR